MSFSTAKQAVFKAINTARQEARLGDREEIERERERAEGVKEEGYTRCLRFLCHQGDAS